MMYENTQNGIKIDFLEGGNAPELVSKLKKCIHSHSHSKANGHSNTHTHTHTHTQTNAQTPQTLLTRLGKLVNAHPVLLFMEGTPEQPRGKESEQAVQLLQNTVHVQFGYFDVCSDKIVHAGIQKYSSTKTFPQLYVCMCVCVCVCVFVCACMCVCMCVCVCVHLRVIPLLFKKTASMCVCVYVCVCVCIYVCVQIRERYSKSCILHSTQTTTQPTQTHCPLPSVLSAENFKLEEEHHHKTHTKPTTTRCMMYDV